MGQPVEQRIILRWAGDDLGGQPGDEIGGLVSSARVGQPVEQRIILPWAGDDHGDQPGDETDGSGDTGELT